MDTSSINAQHSNVSEQEQSEDVMSLRDMLDIFLFNWKWFLMSAIVCVLLARLYLATQPLVYERHAMMLVKEDDSPWSRSSDALSRLDGMMGSSVDNEVYILQSHQLVREVVKMLHLDIMYSCKSRLRTISLYDVKPFSIQFLDEETILSSFSVKIINEHECEIYKMRIATVDEEEGKAAKEWTQTVRFGTTVESPAGRFVIVPNTDYLEGFMDKRIDIVHLTEEMATNAVSRRVGTSTVDRMSTLVDITCRDTNIQRADDILAALLEAYKKSIIDDKNMVAQNTADFIDARIRIIAQELSSVEGDLASFKQANNLVDFSLNASSYLQQSSTARQRTVQLQAQLEALKYVIADIQDNSAGNKLVPTITVSGVGDAGIQSQITKYNEMMLQRNRLAVNSGEDGITVRDMDANLAQMRQSLLASMQGYAKPIDIQVQQALNDEAQQLGSMQSMPQQEKTSMDIARQQTIKETLYIYLLNKREETALQLAVTEANVRIVETPYGTIRPISPRTRLISAVALLIGLLIPFGFFWVRNMLNMGVRGRKDVETYSTIPIIGEIPHV